VILEKASTAIAANPDLSDFSAAISGQWNPAVNLVSVLDNGPYNVFAPTNEAFAKMDPAELEALKANPAELTSVLYYHMALGLLGPDDIHGKLTTQEGAQITVTSPSTARSSCMAPTRSRSGARTSSGISTM